jgi:metal-dependent amidase/aminoacylase/carboxypeptidase family protein
METFVRGKTVEAFMAANENVDRALRAGAMAVGGSVTITTLPGYLPIQSDTNMLELYRANAAALVGKEHVKPLQHRTGSTDMGDVSQIMPVIHPYVVAATGRGHGEDYVVQDYELAVVTGAKAMAMTVIDLLAQGAARTKDIVAKYHAPMTKQTYVSFMRGLLTEATYTE